MSASNPSPAAYLLISHGSRDPRPAQATEKLAQLVRSRLESTPSGVPYPPQPWGRRSRLPSRPAEPRSVLQTRRNSPVKVTLPWAHPPLVGTACLEAGSLPLHQQILEFGQRIYAAGGRSLGIVPLFLLPGRHVLEDVPEAVRQAQRLLPQVSLQLCPHLGSHPDLSTLVQQKLQVAAADTWLLLAHGSRKPEANTSIQWLAQSLGGTLAYWAGDPNLETQVIQLIQKGVQRMVILPYFLFTGTTTDGIIRRTEELAERFPSIDFRLLPPLGPSLELAQLVVDLALNLRPSLPNSSALPLKRAALRHQPRASSLVS
ncbi:MAG TPA: sirohydrochlorin chelatase [Leptolyngbyaceae cyanobacterium M65_K2018_010]|nr:sirohydrochlorin chelatase [Leptolyngbyaceae cyanobacterium M65_K2018_010]